MAKAYSSNAPRRDLYAEVTDKIVAQLSQGVRPWSKPWVAGAPAPTGVVMPRRSCGTPYRGINAIICIMTAMERGYNAATWMTYKQAEALGAHVRKGEKGTTVVYYSTFSRENDAGEEYSVAFLKSYSVFNVEQIDALPETFHVAPQPASPDEIATAAGELVAAAGVRVIHQGDRAFYSPDRDVVVMPPVGAFRDVLSYEATLAHEGIHWTGHASRCAREFGKRFGDDKYAAEELVAELGSAFLCATLGLANEPRPDHAQYLASWIKVLKADSRAIFTAASMASTACDFLHNAAAEPLALAA